MMTRLLTSSFVLLLLACNAKATAQNPASPSDWTIYITNDNCPDYTWGYTEEQTRKAFADIVRGHLDEMNRTDNEAPENRDRYNMAVAQEALCFVEHYPDRKDELIRRIRDGRLYVSPYLCNSLWAFQSVEGAIRTFYPARRLEREWGIPFGVAEHIEEPSLPWGVAPILAGCGIRWLSNPFYNYDSTFRDLKNPPVFIWEGPDGSHLRVVMDPWASNKASYMQGARMLRKPDSILKEWLPHYRQLGDAYPLRTILASGTHGDIAPHSGGQARGFAEAIKQYNAAAAPHPKLVNATLPQFCKTVDEAQEGKPFLETIRGGFGHSWDVWPVSLAKYVADMREGERRFLAAESLIAVAARERPGIVEATRADRERAEWCLAMLADHAWNGNSPANKLHNAGLRRKWSAELNDIARRLSVKAWEAVDLAGSRGDVTLFNSLSVPRRMLVRLEAPRGELGTVADDQHTLASQIVEEEGRRVLYFVSPEIPGFGLESLRLTAAPNASPAPQNLRATPTELESPRYRLRVDLKTGGLASLVHIPNGAELVTGPNERTLCQTVYFDGREHTLSDIRSEIVAEGPVLARLRINGTAAGIRVTNLVTVYAELDWVDFDVRIHKPVTTRQERLCQVFPVAREESTLRIETTGAVIRPRPQPAGDLLPGADTRRFAVQGFVDASPPNGPGVTIAPIDAFVLRADLDPITFEALGNDQNYREVIQDQHGVTEFRFRYALRAHEGGYGGAEAFAWSQSVAVPPLASLGRLPNADLARSPVVVDPARAIATCLKPANADASDCILRLWETAGKSGPIRIGIPAHKRAFRTDLLERNMEEMKIRRQTVTVNIPAHGFAALRLSRGPG